MIQGAILCVLVLSIAVLAGWWLGGVPWLTSVLPEAVTMKPVTACTVALSALGLLLERHRATAVTLFSLSALIMVSAQFDWIPGFLRLEGDQAPYSRAPDVPSIGTSVGFTLLAVAAVVGSPSTAMAATAIGACCLAGYALRLPELFFYVPEVSTAMAVHTGGLLAVLGIAMSRSATLAHRIRVTQA